MSAGIFYSDLERALFPFGNNMFGRKAVIINRDSHNIKPRLDLHEDTEKNLVTATFELPGLSKENIQIEYHCSNGKLTVSAEAKRSDEDYNKEKEYAVQERHYGRYSRTLQLPIGVRDEDINASMDNGVLTVTFPRSTPELESKRITIA